MSIKQSICHIQAARNGPTTDYAALSEAEKDSDHHEADRVLRLLDAIDA